MAGRLDGKTAIVTAAAAGIGRATAEAFAREGARVIAADIDEAGVRSLSGMYDIRTLDVTDAAAITAFAAEVGAIDVLFNGVGWVHNGGILDCSDEDWARSFAINVTPMHRLVRAVLPGMMDRGRGSIVNVASAVGATKAAPNRYAYAATKGAVQALTKAVAIDAISRGVRCNALCPGTIETPSLEGRIAAQGGDARRMFVSRQPLGRLGRPDEVAALAVYLASDESAFMTGTLLFVDGGQTL
jgi:2-keto-3-deoxy-L-fuconate dehydrogenase